MRRLHWKGGPTPSTTIALVATNAALTKAQAKRLAVAAHGGHAKALRFAHALYDGDTVFAVSTAHRTIANAGAELTEIAALAADCLARAIARGVYEATALPFEAPCRRGGICMQIGRHPRVRPEGDGMFPRHPGGAVPSPLRGGLGWGCRRALHR